MKKVSRPEKIEGAPATPAVQTVIGLGFLAFGMAAIVFGAMELAVLFAGLFDRAAVLRTSSGSLVWLSSGFAVALLGASVIFGAWWPATALRHLRGVFATILAAVALSLLLMMTGDLLFTALMERQGYVLCAESTGWRSWTGTWSPTLTDCHAAQSPVSL
jgi:hypothetical protein